MQPHKDLLNRKQVAEYFAITFPTLKRLVESGTIRAYKLGKRRIYFKQTEIHSALKVIPISKKEVQNG
jgi:excisionase family DNA binding protein